MNDKLVLSGRNREFLNAVKYAFVIKNIYRVFCFFPLISAKLYLYLTKPFFRYPLEIKRYVKRINKGGVLKQQFLSIIPDKAGKKTGINPDKIRLAGSEIKIDSAGKIWESSFSDPEDTESLHRFNWLLSTLSGQSKEDYILFGGWGSQFIDDWIGRDFDKKNELIWSSYTVSERISNILIFSYLTNLKLEECYKEEIRSSLEYLIVNLEYKGRHTCNHVFNNARAIFISGCIFGRDDLRELGKKIILEQIGKLVTKDGFLREGSSHYHFLFTRWLLEVSFFARIALEEEFIAELRDYLCFLVNRCWFFLVYNDIERNWSFPLIGDVSPDFPPDWLVSLPWSELALSFYTPDILPQNPVAKGWADLFGIKESAGKKPRENNFHSFSGWYRLDFYRYTIFWHIKNNINRMHVVHQHSDTGSFCFYIDGYPFISDIGRYNYLVDKNNGNSVLAVSHNSLTVDDFDPFAHQRFEYFYPTPAIEVKGENAEDSFKFRITHTGFRRIFGDMIDYERVFRIDNQSIKITDYIKGSRRHAVKHFFHFYPGVSLSKVSYNDFACHAMGISIKFKVKDFLSDRGLINQDCDYYFPSYGKKLDSRKIVITQTKDFPLTQEVDIGIG